jgi:Zn-dependent peptidase ImmA (M78 family)
VNGDADEPDDRLEADLEDAPLPDDWDEQAERLAHSFIGPREPSAADLALLTEFAHLCLRYAYMEVRVQGDILSELPAHLAVIRGEHRDSLAEEAEELARVERANLEIPEGPIEDLADLLDTRGIKVIEGGRALESGGAFLFDPRTGPSLLCLCGVDSPDGRAVLAHEYCHLIADVDPYENRFCPGEASGPRIGRPALGDAAADLVFDEFEVSEVRADLFARAFLVPGDHFRRTLTLFGAGGANGISPARLADVAFYYGVETALAAQRLADLAIVPGAEVDALIAALPAPVRDATTATGPVDGLAPARGLFPAPATRFVNLSLALFLERRISIEQMAYLLGIDVPAARRFLAWGEAPREPPEKPR